MTTEAGVPYPIDDPDESIGDLVGRLTDDFGSLVQSHVQLAKEEIMAEVKDAAKGTGLIGGAALVGWIAVLLISFAAAWGLAELMDSAWLGFLLVGVIWGAIAVALFARGRGVLQEVKPVPPQTIDELQEDEKWLAEQMN